MTEPDVKVTVGIPTFNRANWLRESMASVLSQTYPHFRLLVCDNASDDGTPETVASFNDSRIHYVRSDQNIGMNPNYNRVIELATTEFLLILPDDDLLYPDHLRSTVKVLEHHPRVGVVHTAFDRIDASSRIVEHARALVETQEPVSIESGDNYLERSMRSGWTVCWSSALFRTRALVDADGYRTEDEPMADFPLLRRIACDWDFASVSRSLAALRFHPEAATAALGTFTGDGYDLLDEQPRLHYNQRIRFLEETKIPPKRAKRYRSLAESTFRREKVETIVLRASAGAGWMATWSALAQLVREDVGILLVPAAWRLSAAQLGGRRAKRAARRIHEVFAQAGRPSRTRSGGSARHHPEED